jgi:hypothetical protein
MAEGNGLKTDPIYSARIAHCIQALGCQRSLHLEAFLPPNIDIPIDSLHDFIKPIDYLNGGA